MLDISSDIHSLSDFRRNTAKFAEQLKRTGRPMVLTLNGRAQLVVQDAASYQRLLNAAYELELLRAGEHTHTVKNGRGNEAQPARAKTK